MLHPNRPLKSIFPLIAATTVLLGMPGCFSNDQRTSNSPSSEDESVTMMEKRLQNSARVKLIVSKLDRALRPVANVLSDVEKILKADEKEELRGKISQIKKLSISVVREELDRLKRGLVEKNADGTWSVQETVKWPFERDDRKSVNSMSCDASYLSLAGEPVGTKSEDVNLTLFDCALRDPTTLLRASVSEDLDIKAELNLGDLEQLLKPGASKGPCTIKSSASGTELECAPFVESSGGLVFEFEKISYLGTTAGEVFDFSLKISTDGSHDNDYGSVRATVHKNIGQKTRVEIVRL